MRPTRACWPSRWRGASATAEFLDRWRLPGESASRVWEERFGEHAYVPLGEAALTEALKSAGVTAPGRHAARSSPDRMVAR